METELGVVHLFFCEMQQTKEWQTIHNNQRVLATGMAIGHSDGMIMSKRLATGQPNYIKFLHFL